MVDEVVVLLIQFEEIEVMVLLLFPMQLTEVTEYLLLLLEEQLRQVVDKLSTHSQQVVHLLW